MFLNCPHCDGTIEVLENEVNCGIFRHGIYKSGAPVPPHSPEHVCRDLLKRDLLYGCAMPFKVTRSSDGYVVVKCGWI